MNPNQTNNQTEETEIDLLELFFLLLHHLPLIIFSALALALAVNLGGELLVTPTYVSTARLYVLPRNDTASQVTSAELQSGLMLTQDYQQLVKTREIAQLVIADLNLRDANGNFLSADAVLNKISVSSESNTRVITIRVSDSDPYTAHDINEALCTIAAERIREITQNEAVNVADRASLPTSPSGTSRSRRLMIGALLGAVIAAACLILAHLMNDTIQTSDDIEKYLGLSTLGQIPVTQAEAKKKKKKATRGLRLGKSNAQ